MLNRQYCFIVVGTLGLGALTGCFKPASTGDDDDSTSTQSDSCKSDNDCKGNRVCELDKCVDPAPVGTGGSGVGGGTSGGNSSGATGGGGSGGGGSSSGATGGGGAGGGGSSSGATGGGGAGGGGNSSGATGGGGAGGSGAAGEGGKGGGGVGGGSSAGSAGSAGSGSKSCTTDDPLTCASSTSVNLCNNGTLESYSCSTVCSTLGFATGPCSTGSGCECGDATDSACVTAVAAFCVCAKSAGSPCADSDLTGFYEICHTKDPAADATTLRCFGSYVSGTTVACDSAESACL